MQIPLLCAALATCLYALPGVSETIPHWQTMLLLGDQQRTAHHFEEAEQSYRQALREVEKQGGTFRNQAVCFNRLGLLYRATGQYPQAEHMARRTVDLWEQNEPQNTQERITARSNVGIVLHSERKYHEAEKVFLDVLEQCEQNLGESHPDTASALNNLAAAYYEQGRLTEAEEHYARSYELQRGMKATSTASLLTGNNLALVYADQHRFEEAESLYSEILARLEASLGHEQEATATVLNNLGLLYFHVGRKEDALQYMHEAIQIREHLLGPMHPDALESAQSYAQMLRAMKRKKEAEAYEARVQAAGANRRQTVDISSMVHQQSR